VLRAELSALRAEATRDNDARALARLDQAEQQIVQWEQAAPVLAAAEALVAEAEQLATGTPIDDAQLPARWQTLDLAARTPALTRRFGRHCSSSSNVALAVVRASQQNRARRGSNCTRCCTRPSRRWHRDGYTKSCRGRPGPRAGNPRACCRSRPCNG
jgi:hypothetical protein